MLETRYRIVRDCYAGHEAQVKYWWFPFYWFQVGWINTHVTQEQAEMYVRRYTKEVVKEFTK